MNIKDDEKITISEDAIEYYKKILEKAMTNAIKDALKEFEQNVLDEKLRDLKRELMAYIDSATSTIA